MLLSESLPFIQDYVQAINEAIKQKHPEKTLTRLQSYWLSFVILGILVTNSLCWARFERFGLGRFTQAQLSWMFKRAKIFWELLLQASILRLVSIYHIKEGVLVVDDTDRERSKRTTCISKVHTIRDKKHNGYFKGQNLVFLLLVSKVITIPIGFSFYEPDPKQTAWRKEEARLKAKNVPKEHRPKKPLSEENYPSKKIIALRLIKDFMDFMGSTIRIRAVVADQYYGTDDFIKEASCLTKQSQVISQIRKTQLIIVNNKAMSVCEFFKNYSGKTETISIRGEDKKVTYCTGKFKVKSHDKKYTLVAIKYEDESEYRYLLAHDMTWLVIDIIKTYAFRWLVEVFIQDWKSYEGWNQLAKQPGLEGSDRGVTLSLLSDHVLLLHPDQKALLDHKESAATVGSIREKVMMESLKAFINEIINSTDPRAFFEKCSDKISELFTLRSSLKHIKTEKMDALNMPE